MSTDSYEINKKLSYKVVLYSFFNPGGGIILSAFALFPFCAKNNVRGIVAHLFLF